MLPRALAFTARSDDRSVFDSIAATQFVRGIQFFFLFSSCQFVICIHPSANKKARNFLTTSLLQSFALSPFDFEHLCRSHSAFHCFSCARSFNVFSDCTSCLTRSSFAFVRWLIIDCSSLPFFSFSRVVRFVRTLIMHFWLDRLGVSSVVIRFWQPLKSGF